MHRNMDLLTESFDKSLLLLMQNLGPQLIRSVQLGLTPGQVFMLHFIHKEIQCTASKLAEKMEVAPSAITVMLDRLEYQGFVSRTRDKTDRRVVIIQLTDAGQEKLNQVLDVRKQVMQHCLSQMDSHELDSFIQMLGKIASIAQEMDIHSIIKLSNVEG